MVAHQGKKKIAIVTPYGAEPRFDNYAEFVLAQGLIKNGYEVHFHTYAIKDNPLHINGVYKGVSVIRCRQRFGFSPSLLFSIIGFKPDIVLFFHPRNFLNLSAYIAGRFVGAKIIGEIVGILHDPFIVSDRDNPLEHMIPNVQLFLRWSDVFRVPFSRRPFWNWKNFIFHAPTAHADAIIGVSKEEQRLIENFYKRRAEMIYWCIRTDASVRQDKPSAEKCGPVPERFALFIGQLKRRKGWDTALEAIAYLKKNGAPLSLVFVCSSPTVDEARELAKKLGIEDVVHFMTRISNEEKEWLYRNAQMLLVPSRYEGFGLTTFEAFMAEIPVCATSIPVLLEFLHDGQNALLSPAGDGEALARNIVKLQNDPALREKLISNGKKTAAEFSEAIMIERYLSLFDRLLKNN
ncbi:MAG: hypothetical protein A3B30_04395 [Candidatus Komeilibacteria bacterium RIFCSPLOWO2_01_FULL_52_15]|uniref:Glycosyl transferase family 1 domain-containing protein n=2 Tax=Candidatus Komeiliibacteriota TaxID=1817908 RepID=A0A1G2BPU3_9BACT|nr:MAG: hypothetical protein A2677_04155 [Candidatus Komeilibacteria bacterium RIFCSPHIGHO2_01_FULL_52_14]OGY91121.1 MAG: hypothetical protein A3B30_04395 [Candidatus Komeilibacteria bacterium RIFCSPLOWO2_01_FULL_52_15]